MLTKTLMMGAALAMVASAAMASPASERSEREATRQLNRAQAQIGRAAEDQADAKAVAQVTDASKAGAPPAAAPTMLVQVSAAAPVSAGDTPGDPATNAQAAPTPADAMAPADTSAATAQSGPLASLRNLPARMATASVADSSGRIVGAVQRVETSPEGRAVTVDIALLGKKLHIVSLDAASLSYDAQANRIIAQASADALRAMPNKS